MNRACIFAVLLGAFVVSTTPLFADEREEANVREMVQALSAEANEQLREDMTWPRSESNYADEENLKLDRREVIRTLGRRVDRNPAIDAYIKWQVLSFLPSLDEFTGAEYNQIMRGLPELLPRPELTRQQMQLFEYAAENEDEQLVPMLNEANEQFENNVAEVEYVNRPARAYRDALIDAMPVENGVRWRVLLQDIEERFHAGDMSYEDRFAALRRSVRQHSTNPEIPLRVREQIIDAVDRLQDQRNGMVTSITIFASGNVEVNQIGRPFRGRDIDAMEEDLFPQADP